MKKPSKPVITINGRMTEKQDMDLDYVDIMKKSINTELFKTKIAKLVISLTNNPDPNIIYILNNINFQTYEEVLFGDYMSFAKALAEIIKTYMNMFSIYVDFDDLYEGISNLVNDFGYYKK